MKVKDLVEFLQYNFNDDDEIVTIVDDFPSYSLCDGFYFRQINPKNYNQDVEENRIFEMNEDEFMKHEPEIMYLESK
jgi:hypothetical protein